MTGTTVRIIHSGRLPDSMKASITLRRLASFLGLSSVVASAISWRSWSRILRRSMPVIRSRIASAPMPAVNASWPYCSTAWLYCSSVSSCFSLSAVVPCSVTM